MLKRKGTKRKDGGWGRVARVATTDPEIKLAVKL
jgi:hypothetical protein